MAPNSRGPVSDGEAGVKQTETAARLAAAYREAGHIVAALTQSHVDHSAAFVRTVEFRGPIVRKNALRRRPSLGWTSPTARVCALSAPFSCASQAPRRKRDTRPDHGEAGMASPTSSRLSIWRRSVSSSPSAAHALVARLGIAADDLIAARWSLVERVASALIEGSPLSAAQIRRIAGPAADVGGFQIIRPCAIA